MSQKSKISQADGDGKPSGSTLATSQPNQNKYKYSNPYLNFMIDFREKVRGSDMSQTEIIRQGALTWKKLTDEQKKPYLDAAIANRKIKPSQKTARSTRNTHSASSRVTDAKRSRVSSVSDSGTGTEVDDASSATSRSGTSTASSDPSVSSAVSATGSSDGSDSDNKN